MSGRSVALFRGINVGTAKRVSMAELRELFESLGCSGVETILNSGNVVFTSKKEKGLAAKIEAALLARTGIASNVTVVDGATFLDVVEEDPLAGRGLDPARHLVAFVRDPADVARFEPFRKGISDGDLVEVGDGVAWLHFAAGILDSPLMKGLSKAMGDRWTTRNRATAEKIAILIRRPAPAPVSGAGSRRPSAPSRSRPSTSRTAPKRRSR